VGRLLHARQNRHGGPGPDVPFLKPSESLATNRNLEFEKHTEDLSGADFAFRNSPLGNSTTDPSLNERINYPKIIENYEGFVQKYFTQKNT
jgi:hypothetical protein